jgi:hypothetical protein
MRKGRAGIVAVLIVSLLAASVMRTQAIAWQEHESGRTGTSNAGALGNMNSFALALLLGGLRGPLVMFLWSSSESQKTEHDLADFDTKLEWIRMLQPEFDTVHIFEIWNLAYNISVMMISPANKYVAVMRALQYAHDVEKEKPGDINILNAVTNIYSNKLGGHLMHPEDAFYNRQLREETLTDEQRALAFPEDKSFRRLWKTTSSLDDQNNILPPLVAPVYAQPPGATEWNDGSPLQYLARYQPYPFGISPAGFSFDFAKRAEVAMNGEGQKPLQISPMVVDSRPGLELKAWCEEEAGRGRDFEAGAFHVAIPAGMTVEMNPQLAAIKPDQPALDSRELNAAIFSYDLAIKLDQDARKEYERHLAKPQFVSRYQTLQSHLDDLEATLYITEADRDYLKARLESGAQQARLKAAAAAAYRSAFIKNERIILRYYTEDQLISAYFPKNVVRAEVNKLSEDQVLDIAAKVLMASDRNNLDEYKDDRAPYRRAMARAAARLAMLGAAS